MRRFGSSYGCLANIRRFGEILSIELVQSTVVLAESDVKAVVPASISHLFI